MDNSYSLSPEDKQIWKDLFGPGSLREDLRQSTVDRIVERVIPLLTLKSLRVGKLIPFLEKRNVIAPDSLANLKTDTEQVDSICDLISANQTPHTLFCLYASLSESDVPVHYHLACDIKSIIQSECVEDDSVGGLQERGAVRSQSSAQATRSPNNTQEMAGQRNGLLSVSPAEATGIPNLSGDKGPTNPSGNKGPTNPSGDMGPTNPSGDMGPTNPSGDKGPTNPSGNKGPTNPSGDKGPTNPSGDKGPTNPSGDMGPTNPSGNKGPTNASGDKGPTNFFGDKGPTNPSGDKGLTNPSREISRHITDFITTPPSSCEGSGPQQFVPGSVLPEASLSSADSTSSSGSLKNSLSSVMESNSLGSAAPLSQANDFGSSTSMFQNELIAPSSATSPIELCDPYLLAEFNNPTEFDVFALLVQTGANINLPTNHERSYLLHLAIGGIMFDKVQVLLQYGADTNVAREDGRTPLHLACEQQLIELVRLLVEHGANVNAVDNSGMTCLHLPNTLQEPGIVDYLIQKGAKFDVPTKDGFNTPLAIATGLSMETATRTVSLLLQAGASANGHTQSAVRPLVAAASRGHLDTVELLLSTSANVNLADKNGTTALMAAVLDNHQNIVQLLLDKGADLSCVRSGPYTVNGNMVLMSSTALSDAAYLGNLTLVKLLVEKGAKLTARSQEENAPIVFAAMGGNVEVIDYIVCKGELPENELLEAFVAALKHRHDNCAVFLLQRNKRKDKMLEAATKHCTGDRLDKMFKSIGAGAVQGPSSSSQSSGPDAHLPSLTEAPRRAILPGMAPTVVGMDDLFQPVEALPPARQSPSRSHSTHLSSSDERNLMRHGLGQEAHRQRLIEILHEFAQVCLQAALNNRSRDWLIDHAKKCHHPQLADFFTSYYTHVGTSMDPGKLMEDFFQGEPSVLNFLIQRSIISKARVQEVLNDMGRNSVDFFTELMEAFHHFPGTDHLPYDGNLLVTHLFDGTIVMGHRYRPSSEPFSSDSSERQPTMPTTGGHRLGGSAPPANMRDLHSQQTSLHSSQQASQQSSQQASQQSSQQASQQSSQQASQQSSQQAGSQQTSQQASQQSSQQAGSQQTSQQASRLQSNFQPKQQQQLSNSLGEPPSGENGSRVPLGSNISSTPLYYSTGAMQAPPDSGSSSSNSFNDDQKSNQFSNKIDIVNNFNMLGNEGSYSQMARSKSNVNVVQSLESSHQFISKTDTVALGSTSTVGRMEASASQPQILSETQPPRNELLLTPSEPLPQTQPPRKDSERTLSTGDIGTPEVIQLGTVPSEHAAASPKPKLPSVTAAKDKTPINLADGRQKQDRPKTTPISTATRPKDEISRVGKNVSKPVTAPVSSSHRVQQASNAPTASHRPMKPKGTSVAATLETKPRGKGTYVKPPAKTTAIAEENANDGGEEKDEEVDRKGRDNVKDKKMEDSTSRHRSGTENAAGDKNWGSEGPTNLQFQNQGPAPAPLPGGISTEQSRSFVVHIDIPDCTSGSAHMDELSARFEAARTQCMCTHAHVTLKYGSTRDGPGQLSDSTFMAPLSQCHTMICALCSYMKCSSVLVTANLFVF